MDHEHAFIPPTGVCHSLAYFVNATSELVQTELPLGPGLEGLVKLLTKFYTTTAQLSKYFFLRCKTTREAVKVSRFDKLLEKVGCGHGSLTKNVYAFINHIQVRFLTFSAVKALSMLTQ